MQAKGVAYVPFLIPFKRCIVNFATKSTRKSFADVVKGALGKSDADLEMEGRMYEEVVALLKTHCLDDPENRKLLFAEKGSDLHPRGTETTAAAATLFAMLNRFFGYDGGADMPASVPSL